MPHEPASPDPGRDEDPARHAGEPDQTGEAPEGWRELPPSREDWLTEDQWVAWLAEIEPGEWAGPGEDLPLDRTVRPPVHHRTHPLPDLM